MTVPCGKEQDIDGIKRDVSGTKGEVRSMSSAIERLCQTNAALAVEMRDMTTKLTAHMLDNREHGVRIKHIEEGQAIVFGRVRHIEDKKIPDLEAWQNRMRGALIVFPAVCTGISALAAITAIYIALKG